MIAFWLSLCHSEWLPRPLLDRRARRGYPPNCYLKAVESGSPHPVRGPARTPVYLDSDAVAVQLGIQLQLAPDLSPAGLGSSTERDRVAEGGCRGDGLDEGDGEDKGLGVEPPVITHAGCAGNEPPVPYDRKTPFVTTPPNAYRQPRA